MKSGLALSVILSQLGRRKPSDRPRRILVATIEKIGLLNTSMMLCDPSLALRVGGSDQTLKRTLMMSPSAIL